MASTGATLDDRALLLFACGLAVCFFKMGLAVAGSAGTSSVLSLLDLRVLEGVATFCGVGSVASSALLVLALFLAEVGAIGDDRTHVPAPMMACFAGLQAARLSQL